MLVTIIGIIIMALPFLLLAWEEGKIIKEKEERARREEVLRRRASAVIDIKAIEKRWPFISLWELYHYKKATNPTYSKPISGETWHELRLEHARELKKYLKSSG